MRCLQSWEGKERFQLTGGTCNLNRRSPVMQEHMRNAALHAPCREKIPKRRLPHQSVARLIHSTPPSVRQCCPHSDAARTPALGSSCGGNGIARRVEIFSR